NYINYNSRATMPSTLLVPGIRFNDYVFSEPLSLAAWRPPKCAGVFVVLAKDPNWSPKPFQPLYFGEFGNNASQVEAQDWTTAGGAASLLIATLVLPYSTTAQRWSIQNELVWAYNPAWQTSGARTTTRELVRKIDELEMRQREQNSQILLLLTHISKLFEPQPVGPRRPIGFLP